MVGQTISASDWECAVAAAKTKHSRKKIRQITSGKPKALRVVDHRNEDDEALAKMEARAIAAETRIAELEEIERQRSKLREDRRRRDLEIARPRRHATA